MILRKILLADELISAGEEKRLLPRLEVEKFDRIHIHLSNDNQALNDLAVRFIFGTPLGTKTLLSSSMVWLENSGAIRELSYHSPKDYNKTGLIVCLPVIAPQLFDVILTNNGREDLKQVYVTLLAQEI